MASLTLVTSPGKHPFSFQRGTGLQKCVHSLCEGFGFALFIEV